MNALTAHRVALVAGRRCPACAEPLGARALFGSAPCGRCRARIGDYGLSGAHATATLKRRGRATTVVAAVVAGLAQLAAGWIPLVDVVVALAVAAWLRLAILGPATAVMSPGRRLVTRGTARLMVGSMLAFGLVLSTLLTIFGPLGLPAKGIVAAGQVFGGAFAITRYTRIQLERESAGRPVAAAEVALLLGAISFLVLTVAALALAALWVASTLETWLGGAS